MKMKVYVYVYEGTRAYIFTGYIFTGCNFLYIGVFISGKDVINFFFFIYENKMYVIEGVVYKYMKEHVRIFFLYHSRV